jgi:hypothetical protein
VILAQQEAEIMRIAVQSQLGQVVQETLSRKKTIMKKKRAGGVAEDIGPESIPRTAKEKKKNGSTYVNQ